MRKILALIAFGFVNAAAIPAFAADDRDPAFGPGARTEKQWGAVSYLTSHNW